MSDAPKDAGDVVARGGVLSLAKAREEAASKTAPVPQILTAEETALSALNYLTDPTRARLPRTGFPKLDMALGGFPPGTMTTIGGRTGAGKSSLLLAIAMNQAGPRSNDQRVGIISCEDSEWIWGSRIMAALEDVNPERFFDHPPDPYLVGKAVLAVQQATAYGLHFAFPIGKGIKHVLALIERMISEHGCSVIIVDYLQAISAAGQDRYTARTDAAQAIKGLCHDKGVALIIASQLKRAENGKPFREPDNADLKDSGDIENMSEAIMLLWPESDEEKATALGKVSKVKWSYKRPRFRLERSPTTGALVGISDAPSQQNARRGSDDDYA